MSGSSWFFVAAATLSSWLGFKSVHTEIVINAEPAQVWSVLSDFERHEEWNTVLRAVKGELVLGTDVTYEFHQDKDSVSQIPATVRAIVPNELLNQRGGYSTILTFDHKYILEPTKTGTKLKIYEEYTGVGVHFWDEKPVQQAYEKLATLIKERAEYLSTLDVTQ